METEEELNLAGPSKGPSLASPGISRQVKLLMGGVSVEFPHQPYSVQKYMMSQVIAAMNKMQNCLVESPTGTGKTLGLLCSTLAWQVKEGNDLLRLEAEFMKEKNEKKNLNGKSETDEEQKLTKPPETDTSLQSTGQQASKNLADQEEPKCAKKDNFDSEYSSDEDIFQPPKRSKTNSKGSINRNPESADMKKEQSSPEHIKQCYQSYQFPKEDKGWVAQNENNKKDSKPMSNDDGMKTFKPPTIFYGTRTHKQITQVVDQLKKTSYAKDVKMSILASRDFTCVNPTVKGRPHIADLCKECIDPAFNIGCTYYHKATRVGSHSSVRGLGLPVIFDIEDIVSMGTKKKVCPYFTLRNIVKSSNIVFCPYNYLIHPEMRESMNINIHGAIVILDEAHNIEDICRESASLVLETDNLSSAIDKCREQRKYHMAEEYEAIENYLVKLKDFINSEGQKEYYNNNESALAMSGFSLVGSLVNAGITKDTFQAMLENVGRIEQAKTEDPESNAALNGLVKQVCSDIKCCFRYLYDPENRLKFQSCFHKKKVLKMNEPVIFKRNWHFPNKEWKYALRINCVDPSLVFRELSSARTIILSSGTLSPLDSFITELGVEFKNIVKGNHVVPAENLYVSQISKGPKGFSLKGTYKETQEYYYQDELGRVILETSKIVPHGVLCFFPSYSLMEKLFLRWSVNGILEQLKEVKDVFCEPQDRDKMAIVMNSYTTTIDNSRLNQSARGAIMFGVYRGKIAEGIDFSDENARVVIAVGIPFPNRNSFEVKAKINYNDEMCLQNRNTTYLSGDKWYQNQTFRALNQALGRCIRHKNDWGAIVLVDLRFTSTAVQNCLPVWIRPQIRTFQSWENYAAGLQEFCHRKKSESPNHQNNE